MTREQIISQLTEIFEIVFDRDDLVLTDNLTADDVESWDSLHHIEMIVAVESRFGIKFQIAQTESLKNVGALIDLIKSKISH